MLTWNKENNEMKKEDNSEIKEKLKKVKDTFF